jgi:ABC-type Fe3+/spermidine/putrescine transport system ATPase subunit
MADNRDIAVEVRDLCKNYGDVRALRSVNLSIYSGEYFVLLGPSGGGKTTLLRSIGGFIRPTAGQVILHGHDMTDMPPEKRSTSMVFQSYALFPHMTVAKNVGYGLRLRKMAKPEIAERVEQMLAQVGLVGYGERMPWELSGGQQQRVQLARALILETDIILLDEPLAALDANLRKDMCYELKHLQERVGITFIHVTHNQEEAMTVADRIAIVADGVLVEQGDARAIYRNPKFRFTADFIGENNIFDGEVSETMNGNVSLVGSFGTISVNTRGTEAAVGTSASVSVRSECMMLVSEEQTDDSSMQTISAKYNEKIYLGLTTRHMVTLEDGREVTVRSISDTEDTTSIEQGQDVLIGWRQDDGRLHLS